MDVGEILKQVIPVITLIVGLVLGHRSSYALAAEQRFEDRLARWTERRQELLVRLQRQAHTLGEEAGTALVMGNTGEPVEREAPWFLRWSEARKDLITSSELLGDADISDAVQKFIELQDKVANTKLSQRRVGNRTISVKEQQKALVLSLEDPISLVTSLAAQRYQTLEGPEPTFTPAPWWKVRPWSATQTTTPASLPASLHHLVEPTASTHGHARRVIVGERRHAPAVADQRADPIED